MDKDKNKDKNKDMDMLLLVPGGCSGRARKNITNGSTWSYSLVFMPERSRTSPSNLL